MRVDTGGEVLKQILGEQEAEIAGFYKNIDPSVNLSPLTNSATARSLALVFTQIYLNCGFTRRQLKDFPVGNRPSEADLRVLQLQLAQALAKKDSAATIH